MFVQGMLHPALHSVHALCKPTNQMLSIWESSHSNGGSKAPHNPYHSLVIIHTSSCDSFVIVLVTESAPACHVSSRACYALLSHAVHAALQHRTAQLSTASLHRRCCAQHVCSHVKVKLLCCLNADPALTTILLQFRAHCGTWYF